MEQKEEIGRNGSFAFKGTEHPEGTGDDGAIYSIIGLLLLMDVEDKPTDEISECHSTSTVPPASAVSTISTYSGSSIIDDLPTDEEMDDVDYFVYPTPEEISSGRRWSTETNIPAAQVTKLTEWCGTKYFSALIEEGLDWLEGKAARNVVMVYESPSSSSKETSFYNENQFRIHDFPSAPLDYMTTLRPMRYAIVNGSNYPAYMLKEPDKALLDHWYHTIPNHVRPTFIDNLPPGARVSVYMPLEKKVRHIVEPETQFALGGKDAIRFMTEKTTKQFPDMNTVRPCVAKVTHGFASKGIAVIRNDADAAKFGEFLEQAGNPSYVVTKHINIERSLSCHFFIHPSGEIIWFGSSENLRLPSGKWSADSAIDMNQQHACRELMRPYVYDIASYCLESGYWGFAGFDVLFDPTGKGYVIDVNPRVTGTMPALMVARHMQDKYGFTFCKMRKSSKDVYKGSSTDLIRAVEEYNKQQEGKGRIVLFSVCKCEEDPAYTRVSIAIFGTSPPQCDSVLERFTSKIE